MPTLLSTDMVLVCILFVLTACYAVLLHRRATPDHALRKRLALYFLFFGLPLFLATEWISSQIASLHPVLPPGLGSKTTYYIDNSGDFDLVFLGDSRTYCGIQPEMMDRLLGSSSVNLAYFAHWFPTQYPQMQDLLPSVPAGTTVVWSVGFANFLPVVGGDTWKAYPVGKHNAARYQSWGFRYEDMRRNLETTQPLDASLRFRVGSIDKIVDVAGRLNEFFWNRMDRPLFVSEKDVSDGTFLPEAEELTAIYRRDPEVANVTPLAGPGGRVNSLALRKARGSYCRVELDPNFFREQQAKSVRERRNGDVDSQSEFRADQTYWNLFVGILELYRAHGVRLVVSEIEEAPHTYRGPNHRALTRRFMRERVRPTVESYGFTYLRIDYDLLVDEDYFDYNHLNSRGIETFTPLLAKALQPHL